MHLQLRWIIPMLTIIIFHQYSSAVEIPIPNELENRYGLALEAIFGMGVRLLTLLESNVTSHENFMVSPISATIVIAQLMLGAEGRTQDYLYDLLSLPKQHKRYTSSTQTNRKGEVVKRHLPYSLFHLQLQSLLKKMEFTNRNVTKKLYNLTDNSALFYNQKIDLKPNFKNNLEYFYDTELHPLDFGDKAVESQKLINQWASDHTNGKIDTVLSSPPTPLTSAVFVNALYFSAFWKTPFSDSLNHKDVFHLSSNPKDTVEATFMAGFLENVPYGESKTFKVMSLPYQNDELGMYIVLPNVGVENEYNINSFAETINVKEILKTLATLKKYDVSVKIPKMSLTSSFSILEPLRKYVEFKASLEKTGPKNNRIKKNSIDKLVDNIQNYRNFTSSGHTDIVLTGAAENYNFTISDIVQQMTFAVNENGTEAAAVTSGIIDYIDSKSFLINKPFVFFIRHEISMATLFWGTISNPTRS